MKLLLIIVLTFQLFNVLASPALADPQAGLDIAVLKSGIGARALGMGGAFTAIADNADAAYWNPAGLAQLASHEVTTMQTRMSSDADHYYIGYAAKFLKGTIGMSWIQISLGSISQTTTTDAFNEVITTNIFNYFSNAYMLSYGLPINSNLSVGLTAKYLTSDMTSISQGQAYGYSITPGVLLRITHYALPITIGVKIDELLNEQNWGTGTVEKASPKARIGIAVKEPRGLPLGSTLALDVSQTLRSAYSPDASLGYEWIRDALAIRLGYAESGVTAGAGFRSGMTQLDYAYVQQAALSRNNVHRISLTGKW